MLSAYPDPAVVLDENLLFLGANPAAEEFFGVEAGGLIGRLSLDVIHEPDRIEAAERAAGLLAGSDVRLMTLRVVGAGGHPVWVEATGRRYVSPQGAVRVVIALRDVGWRLERELRGARALSRSMLLSQLAVQFQGVSPGQFADALGIALAQCGETVDAEVVVAHEVDEDGTALVLRGRWVDPASRAASLALPSSHLEIARIPTLAATLTTSTDQIDIGSRFAPHHEVRDLDPVLGNGVCLPLHEGDRLVGVVSIGWPRGHEIDNSERDFAQGLGRVIAGAVTRVRGLQALLESEALFRDLFRRSSAVMYLVDPSTLRLVDVNAAAARFYGYAREEMLGMDLHRLTIHSAEELRRMIADARATERTTVIEEHQQLADGAVRIVEIHSTPMQIARRQFDLAIVQDVTDQRRAHQELQRLASTDDLTGALNRRRFLELATEELARAGRYERPVSLLMLDLDHFKAINDSRGHIAGDEALVVFAKECGALMRNQDRFARLGGEEFAALLPETELSAALALAERVRERAEATGATVSIGVAEWEPGLSIEALYARADKNLYAAKQGGRNQVVG